MSQLNQVDDLSLQDVRTAQREIIAALCEEAPNNEVRDCLRRYDPAKSSNQIKNAFKTLHKEVLVETLNYLGCPGMAEYNKAALPHELLCRVQNLFPDTCHLCQQIYCIKLHDKPIVKCMDCGQGCRNQCVLQLIGKTEDELNEDNQFGAAFLNPYPTLGLFYLCAPCQERILPQKMPTKRKPRENANPSQQSQQMDSTHTQPLEPGTGEPQNIVRHRTESVSSQRTEASTDNNNAQTYTNHNHVRPSQGSSAPERPICKFYKQGRCRHGISGRKDGTCDYAHPKPCPKLLSNGTNSRRGCNKGSSCSLFHPQMCYRSLKDRICVRSDCKFMHVKGTKRSEPQEVNEPSANYVPVSLNRNPTNRQETRGVGNEPTSQAVRSLSSTQHSNSFLEHLKKLEEQLATISSKLQQLDRNYAHLSQQQSKPHPINSPYQPLPPQYYPHLPPPPLSLAGAVPPLRH